MKNPRIALALIAALGVVAVVLWRSGQNPQPPAPTTPAPQAQAPVEPTTAPPAEPLKPQPIQAGPPARIDAPEAPTATGAPIPAGMAIYARTLADGPRVLQLSIDRAGGVRGLDNLRRATYQLFRVGTRGTSSLEALCDERGNVVITDKQAGQEEGLVDGTCWLKRGQLVVTCEPRHRAVLLAMGLAHIATALLPLQAPPWHLKSVGAAQMEGQLTNTLHYSAPHAGESALFIDPQSGRVMRLSAGNTHVALSELQTIGTAQIPTMRRISLYDDDLAETPIAVFADRVASVKPSIEPSRMKPPALTKFMPTQVVARPQLVAVRAEAGTHAGRETAVQSVASLFSWEEMAQAEMYEVLGTPPNLDQGVEVWFAMPPSAGSGNEALRQRLTVVPAEPAVASQILRVPEDQVMAAMQKFLGEVKATGRPAIRYIDRPDPKTHEITIELQVPVQRK